jgi:hypothetical protein
MTTPKLSTRRLALLSGFALLSVLGAASVCSAESPWRRRIAPPAPPPYRVTIEDLDGTPLPTFRQDGATFVLGEPGDRYNIRVYNPTGERIEAVVTVDGRDAISGDVGDYVTQRGYLIEAWGSLLVEGFRRSLDEVAAFRFTGRGGSYSALRGTPQHVGVIGVAVFPEKLRPPPRPVWRPRPRYVPESEYQRPSWNAPHADGYRPGLGTGSGSSSGRAEKSAGAPSPAAAPPPAATAAQPSPERARSATNDAWDDEAPAKRKASPGSGSGWGSGSGGDVKRGGPSNIGTEYGESEGSSVVEVAFERRTPTHPAVVLSLRYDDYDGLQARGIDLSSLGYAYRDPEPEPFPYSRSRFAPPPR